MQTFHRQKLIYDSGKVRSTPYTFLHGGLATSVREKYELKELSYPHTNITYTQITAGFSYRSLTRSLRPHRSENAFLNMEESGLCQLRLEGGTTFDGFAYC